MKREFQALKDTYEELKDTNERLKAKIENDRKETYMLNQLIFANRNMRVKKRKSGIKNVAFNNARDYCLKFKSFKEFSDAHRSVDSQRLIISKIFGRRACAYFNRTNRLSLSNLLRFGNACVIFSNSDKLCNYIDGFEKGLIGNVIEVIAKTLKLTFFDTK